MFEFKGETDNVDKFSCLLCLPNKNVSAFVNSPSNLRKYVELNVKYHVISAFSCVI